MSASVKTESEIAKMREGGKLLASVLNDLKAQAKPGVSEKELNDWVHRAIVARGAEPTYLDSSVGFPGVICISVNDEVVHGIPTNYVLRHGDVVSFDLVITYKNMKTDSAFTMIVGEDKPSDPSLKRLLSATERSLYAGIDAITPYGHVGDIAAAVEKVLNSSKLGIVRELVGHGVGREMHEEPEVPNYGKAGTGARLIPGMTIAIEPMAMLGDQAIVVETDGWTIKTRDGSCAAHFEHTVLITDFGAEILTKL